MAMRRVTSIERLYDFIATVVLCAPDRFPKRDFLAEEDQLTLDRAFAELNAGMEFVRKRNPDPAVHQQLQGLLDESLAAYRRGEEVKGAHLLQDFEQVVFGKR